MESFDRRSEAAPITDRFKIDDVIVGLADDLVALRAGAITPEDARVRAELGKQILNGVRIVINAQTVLERRLRALPAAPEVSEP